jgi:hypothetical protein
MTLDFESDQFLKLLTDALRAGPGSPEWHEAVLRLQAGQEGSAGADEYRMLCDARAHLESGKEYRSVRAGPNFTRLVMNAISDEGVPVGKRFSTANWIAAIAACLLLGTVAMVIYLLVASGSRSDAQSEDVDALSSKLLGNAIASLSLDHVPPADWKRVGKLPLEFSGGMRAKFGPDKSSDKSQDIAAGGLVWQTPMPAGTPFEVEATLKINHSTDDLLPELAVSDVDDFGDENATASHELVWLLQSGQATVILPSGRMQAQADIGRGPHNPLTVRIRIDDQSAIVELDGKRIWAGAAGLAPGTARFIAIRLLRRGGDRQGGVSFQTVRVLTGE